MDLITLIGLCVVFYLLFYTIILAISDCDVGLYLACTFGIKLDYYKDKVVWITGASSGIGEYLAVELASHGAKLALSSRNVAELDRVKKRCISLAGVGEEKVLILPLDVTEFDKHEETFLRLLQHFGKLDVLVCNAGRSQRAFWEEIEVGVDRAIYELNTLSTVNLARIAVRYFLRRSEPSQIAIMSSIAGVFGAPYSASYSASKHALHGYFKALRSEKLDSNIQISLICPGPVTSNFLPQCFTEKVGQCYGQEMSSNDKRMSTERCAYLSAVTIANKLEESWMGVFPLVPLTYILVYMPNIATRIAKLIGVKNIQKMRDNKSIQKKEGTKQS